MKMSDNLTKYEVLIEQYFGSILDISGISKYVGTGMFKTVEMTKWYDS